jgi:crotonobetainyl-CoA:carnitine CoA-transferase CaiB-like acyl-CoA transferase
MGKGILDTLRVLELSDEKGMLCAKLLADMGAETIRVEKPGKEISQTSANAGKHAIGLEIEMEEGRDLLKRLAGISDVFIESYSPGYLSSLGIGYAELSQINPRLVMASITAFGQSGPYRDYQTSELVASALGGQLYVCGEPGKPPLKPFGPLAYYTASLFAANGVMLALGQRNISGKGQYIDISIHECVAATLDPVLIRYFYEGEVMKRSGDLYWNGAFRIFHCKDGYILLSLNWQWETLVEWLESERMAEDLSDQKWRDEPHRRKNIGHIIAVLEKWTLKHNVDELVELGQLMHFPWARVAALPDVVSSPQLNQRGFFPEEMDSVTGERHKYPGSPFIMSRSPLKINHRIPCAGEYNQEVYRNILGLSGAEIERLMRKGVI